MFHQFFQPEVRFQEEPRGNDSWGGVDFTPPERPQNHWLHSSNVKTYVVGGEGRAEERRDGRSTSLSWGGRRAPPSPTRMPPQFHRSNANISTSNLANATAEEIERIRKTMTNPAVSNFMPPPSQRPLPQVQNCRAAAAAMDHHLSTPPRAGGDIPAEYRHRLFKQKRRNGGVPRIRFSDEEEEEEEDDVKFRNRMSTTMKRREDGSPLAFHLPSPSDFPKRPRLRDRESGYDSDKENVGTAAAAAATASPMLKRGEGGSGNDEGGSSTSCVGGNSGSAAVAVVEPMSSPANLSALLKAAAAIAARVPSPIPVDLTSSPLGPTSDGQIVPPPPPPALDHDDDDDYDLDVEGEGESQEVLDKESLIGVQSQKHLLGKKY